MIMASMQHKMEAIMEKQTNPKLILSVAALVFISVIVWQKAIKQNNQASELANIAQALEQASNNQDKFAAADQFEKLTKLKNQYSKEKNIPCLNAVFTLEGVADEVNATGYWQNPESAKTSIKECNSNS